MADATTLKLLAATLLAWIHANTGLDLPAGPPPEVRLVGHSILEHMACTEPCAVLGFTPDDAGQVFLDERLDVTGNVCEKSILLHELVHYIQHRSGRFSNLPPEDQIGSREGEALRIQDLYLRQHGRRLYLTRGTVVHGMAPPFC